MVTINYDEFNPDYESSYKAVSSYGRVFATGDVIKDFADAVAYDMEYSGLPYVTYSSAVDHFVQDTPGFCFDDTGMIVRDNDDNNSRIQASTS